jgi:uncharacterized membrane protein YdjX (TVP38/TMEM64 family)
MRPHRAGIDHRAHERRTHERHAPMNARDLESAPKRGSFTRRALPLAVLLVAGLLLVAYAGGPQQVLAKLATNREWLNGLVMRHSLAAAFAYVTIYTSLMLLLWIPPWLCTLIGGFLFGIWLGVPLALVSACSGSAAVFLLARRGLGGLTERAGPFVHRLEDGFRKDAFNYLLVLRLIPVVPFIVVNLVPAVIGVPLRTFVLATAIGIAPSTLIYASIGNALSDVAQGEIALDAGVLLQPQFALPLIGLALLALLPVLYRWMRARRVQS